MASSDKIERWKYSAIMKFSEALKLPHFVEELDDLHNNFETREGDLSTWILNIISRYNLPRTCYEQIKYYIIFKSEIDINDLHSPIMLLSQKDNYVGPKYDLPLNVYWQNFTNHHVLLDLTGEIQKQDLLDFINTNWKLIESKLKLVEPTRPGAVRSDQTRNLKLKVLSMKEQKGLTISAIAVETGLTEEAIKSMLRRIRQGRNNDAKK